MASNLSLDMNVGLIAFSVCVVLLSTGSVNLSVCLTNQALHYEDYGKVDI
jgi:hypothetical protein